jgi:epoxyqueuosine reductase
VGGHSTVIFSEEVKQFIQEECKAEVVGIAPATPFREEDRKRITATMEVLQEANPATMSSARVFDPADFVEGARAVIVAGINSYFGPDPYSGDSRKEIPRGAIGNFYLNENILSRSLQHSSLIIEFLQSRGFKADLPFIGLPQKIKAIEAGIGIWGKNTLVLNKKLGSWIALFTIVTNAPLEPDKTIQGDCGTCTRCVDECPTGALSNPYIMQVNRCLIYYLCYLKGEIPMEVREKIGVRIANCTMCSDVCPHNSMLTINEADKLPDEIIYPELIPLMNLDDGEYEKRYGSKMFGLIMGGRRYLRRNIAVALGNSGSEAALPCLEIAAQDEDPLVCSHAAWAIERIKKRRAEVNVMLQAELVTGDRE